MSKSVNTNIVRRTQKERKAATVEKLINATIATIIDVGYHSTSLSVICKCAGVSQGGLFRHFPSRKALIIAAAEEINVRLTAEFIQGFQRRNTSDDFISVSISLVQKIMHSPEQSVWHELLVAARTDPELCLAIAELEQKLNQEIRDFVGEIATEMRLDVDESVAAALLLIRCYDGLALINCLYEQTSEEDAIGQLLLRAGRSLKVR